MSKNIQLASVEIAEDHIVIVNWNEKMAETIFKEGNDDLLNEAMTIADALVNFYEKVGERHREG